MAKPETTRIDSLNVLLDGSSAGKMLLKEAYDGVIENVQKGTVSSKIKNTDLSGDPTSGTVEAKRFVNSSSQPYETARTAAKGTAVKGSTVTVAIEPDEDDNIEDAKANGVEIQPYEKKIKKEDSELIVERGIAVYTCDIDIESIPTWKLAE